MRIWQCVPACAVALLALAFASCTPQPSAGGTPAVAESNARILDAEMALERGRCHAATVGYESAAQQLKDARVLARAVEVALDCGEPEIAQRSAERWQRLTPGEVLPWHAGVLAALDQSRIDSARAPWRAWLKVAPATDAALVREIAALSAASGAVPTLALLQAQPLEHAPGPAVALTLARLALDAWDCRQAMAYALQALKAGADPGAAQTLIALGAAGLGDTEAALSAARAAATHGGARVFLPAEVLERLGREREAHQALLEFEHNKDAGVRAEAQRRLALAAFNAGDLQEDGQRLGGLLQDQDSAPFSAYYLARLAEQRGASEAALRGYALLEGTDFGTAAHARSARLLCRLGQRDVALGEAPQDRGAGVRERLAAHLQRIDLLADCDAGAQALSEVEQLQKDFGGHAGLQYQRAVLLERLGRTDRALEVLERLHHHRPSDSEFTNALGFTLADHARDLARAETLINAALAQQPDNPAILDSLAWLKFRRGQGAAALPLLERAWRMLQDGEIGAHWGEVLWSLGEHAKARDVWQRAARMDPDAAVLQRLLQQHALQPDTEV